MKINPVKPMLTRLALRLLSLPLAMLLAQAAPTATQVITLKPGWNSISTFVDPVNPEVGAVFAGMPVDSVWAYDNDLGTPDFIQEVTEQSLAKAGWRSWVPAGSENFFQNDLFNIRVNRAYLVKCAGDSTNTLTLTGRPSLRRKAWIPDTFNFRGLPVDPAVQVRFDDFFKASPAHYSTAAGLVPIYRLDAAGVWQQAAPADLIRSGEAYWIQCRGGSEFVAPFTPIPYVGDGLDFSGEAVSLELALQNLNATNIYVTVRDLSAPAAGPLAYSEVLSDLTATWPALPSPWVSSVPAGQSVTKFIAVRRTEMTANEFETVLEFTDGMGSRHLVPVSAIRFTTASSGGASGDAKSLSPTVSLAGLWVGQALVNAVSEAHSGPLTTNVSAGFTIQLETNAVSLIVTTNLVPNSLVRTNVSMAATPTAGDFSLRLLLHVDAAGQTRLLKEVIEMWQDGVSTNDAGGNTILVRPGRFVLLTDDSLVGNFTGISARDGVPVGRRLSTTGFDFADNDLPLSGSFAMGSSVTGTNTMSGTFARNPFKHRYHPAHQTGFDIKRVIRLDFATAPTNAPPGYGERVIDGLYHETVTGLHRTNIVAGGTFRLTRIASTPVLNQ